MRVRDRVWVRVRSVFTGTPVHCDTTEATSSAFTSSGGALAAVRVRIRVRVKS